MYFIDFVKSCYVVIFLLLSYLLPTYANSGDSLKNCLAKDSDKIIYNVDSSDSSCTILYNLGDIISGFEISNKIANDLNERLTGTPCSFDSDTDGNITNYKDGIISQKTTVLNGSSINISCKTGYELNNVNNRTIYCDNGELKYDFAGCKFTGNRGTDLKTFLVEYLSRNNYSLDDLDFSKNDKENIFAFDTLYSENTPVTINCKTKIGYASTNSFVAVRPLGYERWEEIGKICEYAQQCLELETSEAISETTLSYYSNVSASINDCSINWGDGNITPCGSVGNNHKYSTKKQYKIKICGNNLLTGIATNINTTDIFTGSVVSSGISPNGTINNGYVFYNVGEEALWFVMLENLL